MLYQISDGTVSLGGRAVLSHIDFSVRGKEKIAVVGENGAGKTTLLRLLAGELFLDRDDKRKGPGLSSAGPVTVHYLRQEGFSLPEKELTVRELFLEQAPPDVPDRAYFGREAAFLRQFTALGFAKEDAGRQILTFSGGERTKLALLFAFFSAPDILLLDEPTNHLDLAAVQWLEQAVQGYEKAVVMVSHDRFFLDRTAQAVWELAGGKLERYAGNYTAYRREKKARCRRAEKAFRRKQEEADRLSAVAERFKHRPRKAAFARAKKKQVGRLGELKRPDSAGLVPEFPPIEPAHPSAKLVWEARNLPIGYGVPLASVTVRIVRGRKIGVLGANGAGKSTLLKTVAGLIPPADRRRLPDGEQALPFLQVSGKGVVVGYFDQQSAGLRSDKTAAEHFHDLFPALTQKEVRGRLSRYLLSGKTASVKVDALSGGERARLVLAELLEARPNFLILDEPTNHMDIPAKEAMEAAFSAYTGTILFVSHDRYFIREIADSLLVFEGGEVLYHPFGYGHYLEQKQRRADGKSAAEQVREENAALAAGFAAVPKPERHRLSPLPEAELYADWKLAPVTERMAAAGEFYGKAVQERLSAEEAALRMAAWPEDETECGAAGPEDGAARGGPGRLVQARAEEEKAWEDWHEQCLLWLDVYGELYG